MDFLDEIILDNSVRHLLQVGIIILIVLIFRRWLSGTIASLIYIPVKRNWSNIDKKEFTGLIIKPLGWLLTAMIAVFAIDKLTYPEVCKYSIYGHSLEEIVQRIGLVVISLYFLWFLLSLINFVALVFEKKAKLTKDKRDDQIITFFRDFLKAIVYILGILLLLKVGFNRNIGNIITGLSIIGAALALAAKESIENLIASFIIFFDKPFFTGDTVKVNNVTGSVEHIGLRSTRVRTIDKTLVTVPNKQMVDSVVDNWSMRTNRRVEAKLEFEADSSMPLVNAFVDAMNKFLEAQSEKITKHSVFFTEFGKSGLVITIEYFTQPFSMAEYNFLKQEFNIQLKNSIESIGLKLTSAGNDINIFGADTGDGPAKSKPML